MIFKNSTRRRKDTKMQRLKECMLHTRFIQDFDMSNESVCQEIIYRHAEKNLPILRKTSGEKIAYSPQTIWRIDSCSSS